MQDALQKEGAAVKAEPRSPRISDAKKDAVKEIRDLLGKSAITILTTFKGVKSTEIDAIRSRFREADIVYRVLKNTLLEKACVEETIEGLTPYLVGPTGVLFGMTNEVEPAKVIVNVNKEYPGMSVKCGYLDGRVLTEDEVTNLSKMPGKQEMLSIIAGLFEAPMSQMASLIEASLREMASLLAALEDKQKEET